jgi:hypothetical protein
MIREREGEVAREIDKYQEGFAPCRVNVRHFNAVIGHARVAMDAYIIAWHVLNYSQEGPRVCSVTDNSPEEQRVSSGYPGGCDPGDDGHSLTWADTLV